MQDNNRIVNFANLTDPTEVKAVFIAALKNYPGGAPIDDWVKGERERIAGDELKVKLLARDYNPTLNVDSGLLMRRPSGRFFDLNGDSIATKALCIAAVELWTPDHDRYETPGSSLRLTLDDFVRRVRNEIAFDPQLTNNVKARYILNEIYKNVRDRDPLVGNNYVDGGEVVGSYSGACVAPQYGSGFIFYGLKPPTTIVEPGFADQLPASPSSTPIRKRHPSIKME